MMFRGIISLLLLVTLSLSADTDSDCIQFPNTICLGKSHYPLPKPPTPPGLVSWYTFDTVSSFPSVPPPPVGPGHLGVGTSALINSTSSYTAPSSFITSEFTISFLIFPISLPSAFSSILSFSKGFSILVYPDSTRLRIELPSSGLDSISTLPLRAWSTITITKLNTLFLLYINGILDIEVVLPLPQIAEKISFVTLGHSDSHIGYSYLIDDLKIFNLADLYSGGTTSGIYAGFSNSGPGCSQCTLQSALTSCNSYSLSSAVSSENGVSHQGRHLCSKAELNGGMLAVAKRMGWISTSEPVTIWTSDTGIDEAIIGHNDFGVGLCCPNV